MHAYSAQEATTVFAPRIPREIAARNLLWSGGIVSVKIPKVCDQGSYENLRFIKFGRAVRGGFVNFFVHGESSQGYCGRNSNFEVEIMEKIFADRSTFYHVDLKPTDKVATHRLVVHEKLGMPEEPGTVVRLVLPAPLQGVILVTTPKPPKVLLEKSTGDTKLDAYLGDGWMIASDTGVTVNLYKGTGINRRTMVHYKPRLKTK